jgi:predicted Abi (CAAX) family protease
MNKPAPASFSIIVAALLILGSFCLIPLAQAADTTSEKVPAPQISEFHNYNKSETYNGQAQGNFDNEEWSMVEKIINNSKRYESRYDNSIEIELDKIKRKVMINLDERILDD